jgi:excisionase family DNA binding protein
MTADEELTAGEAAVILGVNRQRVNELARAGRIGRQVAGRYWVFTRAELEAFKSAPKSKGGRPKEETGTPARAILV